MGNDDEALIGFGWRGGAERETTGVLLWSKPYVCTLPNGEEVCSLFTGSAGINLAKLTHFSNVSKAIPDIRKLCYLELNSHKVHFCLISLCMACLIEEFVCD